jgi:group I intron endonuclease
MLSDNVRFGIIYKATNIINGKHYIGQTTQNLKKRKIAHKTEAKQNKKNMYFHNALNKYGFDNFEWEIICECSSKNEMNKIEEEQIKKYNSQNKKYGYNLLPGGKSSSGFHLTEECKNKIRISNLGKHQMSDDLKSIMSINRLGDKNPMFGKILSKEHKKKMSDSLRKYDIIKMMKAVFYRTKEYLKYDDISKLLNVPKETVKYWVTKYRNNKDFAEEIELANKD